MLAVASFAIAVVAVTGFDRGTKVPAATPVAELSLTQRAQFEGHCYLNFSNGALLHDPACDNPAHIENYDLRGVAEDSTVIAAPVDEGTQGDEGDDAGADPKDYLANES